MPEPEDFGRLSDLLGDACEAAASPSGSSSPASLAPPSVPRPTRESRQEAQGDVARALASAWPSVVGTEVAANATPVHLKKGRLTVSTSSSVWAQTLQYMSADFAARLNECLKAEAISEIVFRHAGWEERPRSSTRERSGRPDLERAADTGSGELSAEQKQALDAVEDLELPLEIKQKVTGAMRASFVRTQRQSVR